MAVSCCDEPDAMLGLVGSIEMETNVAEFVRPFSLPHAETSSVIAKTRQPI